MKNLSNITIILLAIPTVIKLALRGSISPEGAGILLTVITFIAAGGKAGIKFIAAILGLYLFAKETSQGNQATAIQIFSYLLYLAIMFIGLYVMFRSLFSGKAKR